MLPKLSQVTNSSGESPPGSSSNTGAIAGGVVGGLAALTALAGLLFFLRRRRSRVHGGSPDGPTADVNQGTASAPLDQAQEAPTEPGYTGGGGAGWGVDGKLAGDSLVEKS